MIYLTLKPIFHPFNQHLQYLLLSTLVPIQVIQRYRHRYNHLIKKSCTRRIYGAASSFSFLYIHNLNYPHQIRQTKLYSHILSLAMIYFWTTKNTSIRLLSNLDIQLRNRRIMQNLTNTLLDAKIKIDIQTKRYQRAETDVRMIKCL